MALDFKTSYSDVRNILGKPLSVAPERFSKIGEGYQFTPASEYETDGVKWWEDPTPTTRFANLPESIGGQYAVDPNKKGTLFHSEAIYNPELNRQIRGGASSNLFEIDHMMPRALGGTDNLENKILLTRKDHAKKTKVGAVAQELYYNGVIKLGAARVMALNWKDKDVDGIVLDDKGRMDLATAQKKVAEWQKLPEIGFGNLIAAAFKGILPKGLEKKIDWDIGTELVAESFKKGSKGVTGEFAQGLASGVTGGWIPAEGYTYDTKEEQMKADIARTTGNIIGFLVPWSLFARLVGKGFGAATVAKGIQGGKFSIAAKEATGLAKIVGGTKAYKFLSSGEPLIKFGKIAPPRYTVLSALSAAGLFTIHGQLSKQQEAGFTSRIKRILSDASFGTLLGAAGKEAKAIPGLAIGVYALSAVEGADASEAFMNTAIIVGLHGIGGIGNTKRLEAQATKIAIDFRAKYGILPLPESTIPMGEIKSGLKQAKKSGDTKLVDDYQKMLSKIKTDAKSVATVDPTAPKYTQDQIINDNQKAFRKIDSLYMSPELNLQEKAKIIISGRQLYKGGLSREMKLKEDIADLKSLAQRNSRLSEAETQGITPATSNFFGRWPNFSVAKKEKPVQVKGVAEEKPSLIADDYVGKSDTMEAPTTGEISGTGMGNNIYDGTSDILTNYIKASGPTKGKGDKVLLLLREDPKMMAMVEKNKLEYEYPKNNLETLASKDGRTYGLGMVPDKRNIAEWKNPTRIKNGYKVLDINLNKDSISKRLRKDGQQVVSATIENIGIGVKGDPTQPWYTLRITDKDWAAAPELNKQWGTTQTAKVKTALKEPPVVKQEPIILEETNLASNKIENNIPVKGFVAEFEIIFAKNDVASFRKSLREKTGIDFDANFIDKLYKTRKDRTVGEVIRLVGNADEKGKLNTAGKALFGYIPKETYIDIVFNEAPVGKLKLFGGKKKIETGEITQKIKLKETPEKVLMLKEPEIKALPEGRLAVEKSVEKAAEALKESVVAKPEIKPVVKTKAKPEPKPVVKEIPEVEKIDISKSTKKSPYFGKDKVKFAKANKLISRGSNNSSSKAYAIAAGDKANVGNYKSTDVVGISVEGKRAGRLSPDFKEIKKAIDAKATFITDNKYNRNREYNIGEREVVEYLNKNNYHEVKDGVWIPEVKPEVKKVTTALKEIPVVKAPEVKAVPVKPKEFVEVKKDMSEFTDYNFAVKKNKEKISTYVKENFKGEKEKYIAEINKEKLSVEKKIKIENDYLDKSSTQANAKERVVGILSARKSKVLLKEQLSKVNSKLDNVDKKITDKLNEQANKLFKVDKSEIERNLKAYSNMPGFDKKTKIYTSVEKKIDQTQEVLSATKRIAPILDKGPVPKEMKEIITVIKRKNEEHTRYNKPEIIKKVRTALSKAVKKDDIESINKYFDILTAIRKSPTQLKVGKVEPKDLKKLTKAVSPKVDRSSKIYKELYADTKNKLDDLKGEDRLALTHNLKNILDSVRFYPETKVKQKGSLNLEEINRIEKQVAKDLVAYTNDLVNTKFDAKVEAATFGGSAEKIKKQTLDILNVLEKPEGIPIFKIYSDFKAAKKMGDKGLMKEYSNLLSKINKKLEKQDIDFDEGAIIRSLNELNLKAGTKVLTPKGMVETVKNFPTLHSTKLKKGIEEGIKSKNEVTSTFNKTLDEFFKAAFGKKGDYGNNFNLNYALDPNSKNGKLIWRQLYRDVNPQGYYESQPREVILKEAKRWIDDASSKRLSKAEEKDIWGKRKEEARGEEEARLDMVGKKGRVSAEEADVLAQVTTGFMSMKDISRLDSVTDLTVLDRLFRGMRRMEAAEPGMAEYGKAEAISDAKSLVFRIIKLHNQTYPKSTVGVHPKITASIVEKLEKEFIIKPKNKVTKEDIAKEKAKIIINKALDEALRRNNVELVRKYNKKLIDIKNNIKP